MTLERSSDWTSTHWLWVWVSSLLEYGHNPPAIQKQHWHSREAQIELPLIECVWAFRIRAIRWLPEAPLESLRLDRVWAASFAVELSLQLQVRMISTPLYTYFLNVENKIRWSLLTEWIEAWILVRLTWGNVCSTSCIYQIQFATERSSFSWNSYHSSYLVITKTHNLTRTFSTKHSANFTGS
jgi:hypothetical protein